MGGEIIPAQIWVEQEVGEERALSALAICPLSLSPSFAWPNLSRCLGWLGPFPLVAGHGPNTSTILGTTEPLQSVNWFLYVFHPPTKSFRIIKMVRPLSL